MPTTALTLQKLWRDAAFKPNDRQEQAILYTDGPLYLPAGPGSGKTRVLLWRALNLIVFHDVKPQEIYLSTFTEKAALQLREGLRAYLGAVTNVTQKHYDISQMYVGTVHSLCHRLIQDRRFYTNRVRPRVPTLMDDLRQYFYLYKAANWDALKEDIDLGDDANRTINSYFGRNSQSRHEAVTHCIALFNRFSEECLDVKLAKRRASDPTLKSLICMYERYMAWLRPKDGPQRTDLSLLQQSALNVLSENTPHSGEVFKHVIIDEYQDTNTVQERLFFSLAAGHKNICVVGDDDQALYRFRGATVENFVEFEERCKEYLGVKPERIPLSVNYRSRTRIVSFYTDFMKGCNRKRAGNRGGYYRIIDKDVRAISRDSGASIVASTLDKSEEVCAEIAGLIRRLVDEKKVENPNQIAFLFPSLKSVLVKRMEEALKQEGLLVYAPRAGTFLDVDESMEVFGLFMKIFGRPDNGFSRGRDHDRFVEWMDRAEARAGDLILADRRLAHYIDHLHGQIEDAKSDFNILCRVAERNGWNLKAPYDIMAMKHKIADAVGLTDKAHKALVSLSFERIILKCFAENRPLSLSYIIGRAAALDLSVLDLLYRLCGFDQIRAKLDQAECGEDEGPICNLSLISQYLAIFIEEYRSVITANLLADGGFSRMFFSSFLFSLFRRGESEYEDAEDPFPKGRIPFLTIHQAKGLEFPIVVLGNLGRNVNEPQPVEIIVDPLLRRNGEPLERMSEFDAMRMFYVALSRAKNLLVIAHYHAQGVRVNEPFKTMLNDSFPRIPQLDIKTVPAARLDNNDLPKNYSYTGDYLMYQKCSRQYMIFRKYDFVPARSQVMMFGNLVHRTMDDLHQLLIAQRNEV